MQKLKETIIGMSSIVEKKINLKSKLIFEKWVVSFSLDLVYFLFKAVVVVWQSLVLILSDRDS